MRTKQLARVLGAVLTMLAWSAMSQTNVVQNGDFDDGLFKWTPGDSTSAQIVDGWCYFGGDRFKFMQGVAQVGTTGAQYRLQFDYLSFIPFSVKFTRPGGIMTLVTLPAVTDWEHFDTVFFYPYDQIRLLQFTGQMGNVNIDNIVMERLDQESNKPNELNYITNGTMDADEDEDGLADGWYFDNNTDGWLESGWQYCSSNYACEFGQEIDVPNPYGKTFRLQFDIESNDYTQTRVWIDEVGGQGFICSAPNPQPIGLQHYDLTFYYFNQTIAAIGFRTIHPGKWMKTDNVILTEVFGVGVPEPVSTCHGFTVTEYYDMVGNKLNSEPNKGMYIRVRNGQARRFYK